MLWRRVIEVKFDTMDRARLKNYGKITWEGAVENYLHGKR